MRKEFKQIVRTGVAFVLTSLFILPALAQEQAIPQNPEEAIEINVAAEPASTSQRRDYEAGRALETFFNIFKEVNLYYVDTINARKMIKDAADAMLSKLDPYTEYVPSDKMEDFETMTTGKYAGMGSLIRQHGEWTEISEPYKDTPSDRAGLKAGDRILQIDGEDMKGKPVSYVSDKLRGKPGTKVSVTVRPIADTTTVRTADIIRERIQMPAVPYYGWVSDSIGYVRLDTFTENCSAEVRKAIASLQNDESHQLSGLILDVRSNGGGILGEAVKIVGQFVPRGTTVVSMKGRVQSMNTIYKTTTDPIALDLPLAVLINRSTASASEIVAGALQDLDRAVIIGQRSFGKGLVQSPRPVADNEIVKMTMAKYYIPTGRSIQAVDYSHRNEDGSVGVIPDSLIKAYKTVGGRTVYDGGGIMPDVKVEDQYYGKFTAILIALGYMDDFANQYAIRNPAPANLNSFTVSDKLYQEFTRFMADKPIDFESMTERKLKELRTTAEREKYSDRITAELNAIAEKIKEDKAEDLKIFAPEIRAELAAMIVNRWGYNAARIEYELQSDEEVDKAVEILRERFEYNRIITSQDTERK